MFVTSRYHGHNRNGEQTAAGDFLIVAGGATFVLDEESGRQVLVKMPLRAALRGVRLIQFGHWMMGSARLGKTRLTISGAYGSDGLPVDVEKVPYDKMMPLPADLERAFWNGGGHNSAGSEAVPLRAWALSNAAALRKAGR